MTGLAIQPRLPPANLEAEQGLLGALLRNNKALDRVAAFLEPRHFADDVHARIYGHIREQVEAGRAVDAIAMRHAAEAMNLLEEFGGANYIAQLLGITGGIIMAGEYGRAIRDCWIRRQLIDLCERGHEAAFLDTGAAEAILGQLDTDLMALARDGQGAQATKDSASVARAMVDDMMAAIAREDGLSGITTGIDGLDRMLGGMRGGDLLVIGARPSMGKTALSAVIAARAAARQAHVLYVSAEMLAKQVMSRVAAAVAGLPVNAVLRGSMDGPDGRLVRLRPDSRETQDLVLAARRVGQLPIEWDDASVATLPAIRDKARLLRRQGKLDVIVVDYLGRLTASSRAMGQNRVAEISELTSGLKALAMELGVPVLLLSQLSRKVEERDDKTPVLSDLRDSGTIEQDADAVMFLYREHYYLIRSKPTRRPKEKADDFDRRLVEWGDACHRSEGQATVIIAKQRQGPVGPVRLRFDDRLTWFFNDNSEGELAVPGLPE